MVQGLFEHDCVFEFQKMRHRDRDGHASAILNNSRINDVRGS